MGAVRDGHGYIRGDNGIENNYMDFDRLPFLTARKRLAADAGGRCHLANTTVLRNGRRYRRTLLATSVAHPLGSTRFDGRGAF